MTFLDDIKDWTEIDGAALALGRALGVFSAATTRSDARAVLEINNAAGNTLTGMLERLVWLGLLELDEAQQRYRAATPTLHPLSPVDGVPSLDRGPPRGARIRIATDATGGAQLEADRAGFRFLARVFDEIAGSGLDSGWQVRRDDDLQPAGTDPGVTIRLIDPGADEPTG
jgi:hypothetical protein